MLKTKSLIFTLGLLFTVPQLGLIPSANAKPTPIGMTVLCSLTSTGIIICPRKRLSVTNYTPVDCPTTITFTIDASKCSIPKNPGKDIKPPRLVDCYIRETGKKTDCPAN